MTRNEIIDLAREYGARDPVFTYWSARLAIYYGDDPAEVFAALRKNCPQQFYPSRREARQTTRS